MKLHETVFLKEWSYNRSNCKEGEAIGIGNWDKAVVLNARIGTEGHAIQKHPEIVLATEV